jgi:hypothetical protein
MKGLGSAFDGVICLLEDASTTYRVNLLRSDAHMDLEPVDVLEGDLTPKSQFVARPNHRSQRAAQRAAAEPER